MDRHRPNFLPVLDVYTNIVYIRYLYWPARHYVIIGLIFVFPRLFGLEDISSVCGRAGAWRFNRR